MVTMQVLPNREDWLKHRTKIGGSDASAILGKNPYKTNVELWKDKAFHLMPEDISDKLYIQGKDLDDVAADNKKSYSWASTMHGRALAHVQGVLDTLEALPENSGKYRFRKGLKL